MSRHEWEDGDYKHTVGWDQPLITFFYQKHDKDGEVVTWEGITPGQYYDLDTFIPMLRRKGISLPPEIQQQLHKDRDDGA